MNRKYDLEERLIAFVVRIVTLVESLPNNKAPTHLGNQLLRSIIYHLSFIIRPNTSAIFLSLASRGTLFCPPNLPCDFI